MEKIIYLRNNLINKITKDLNIIKKINGVNSDEKILNILLENNISKDLIIKEFENHYAVNYVDLEEKKDFSILKDFNLEHFESINIFPYKKSNDKLFIAISNITDLMIQKDITSICLEKGYKEVLYFFAFDFEIKAKWKEINKILSEKNSDTDFNLDNISARDWLDVAIKKGVNYSASDIHIEPQEKGLQLRYRVDGILSFTENFNFSKELINSIITRLKVISGMKVEENRKPQDGRIENFRVNDLIYDLRTSTIPIIFGEKAVLRIFLKEGRISTFEELGFSKTEEETITKLIKSKYGILYLSGATGSGKTTTLYTMIQTINDEKLNIYTIEDPVEKTIKNVNQIQINPSAGVNYDSSLKSLLRQDPDIIVVGEVRDRETSESSIKASLTGHLVLTTLHANNAIETISRLYNMGIEPYMLSAAILGFISQRLIRTLCPHCKEEYELTPSDEAWINHLEKKYNLQLSKSGFYKAKGCPACNYLGYKGRIAITEILSVDEELKGMIAQKKETKDIYNKVIEKGFVTLEMNAYNKAQAGLISIEEIIKTIQ